MSVVELYGKCKQLGYCDCRGFFGCLDSEPVAQKPDSKELKAASRHHEPVVNEKDVASYAESIPEWDKTPPGTLVECEVCDRSHRADHPHIANIEGDTPLDVEETAPAKSLPSIDSGKKPLGRAELPDWLKDHASVSAGYATKRRGETCGACGKIRRSNHNCKGTPEATSAPKTEDRCEHCTADGLCVRHGGRWANYDIPRAEPAAPGIGVQAAGRVAIELPTSVDVSLRPAPIASLDPELAAMAAILKALDGLAADQVSRVWAYIQDRKGIKRGTNP
jgi:hypothetical protein